MPQNELTNILTQYKDSIGLIITGFAGSITHIFNKIRKGERLTFGQHISHIVISGFVGYIAGLICSYFGIGGDLLYIIIGMSSYSGIQIIEAIDMFKAKVIFDLILDFLKFKIGKK